MGKALAVSFIVGGIIAFTWAALMWHKFSAGKGRNWIILMMVCAGAGAASIGCVPALSTRA